MQTLIPIPLELRDALDDGKVVFFCGAGLSQRTGLADFKQLTRDVFKDCGLPLDENSEDFPEDLAFKNKQYDRALHLLENQSRYMRRAVQAQLSKQPEPGSLNSHKAILDLSRMPDGGHRVVTTNFDDRFELAEQGLKWQAAPGLEPPRGADWGLLTYLHGRLDRETDPEGRRLVLTSADFARAYLQDGWASRFTQYLFEHYTIVFVGYSLADPVVSYVIDGVAAEMKSRGRKLDAYIFADHDGTPQDQKRKQAVWETRGLKPLCFDSKGEFEALHDTLHIWANHHAKGIDGRIQFTLDLGQQPYDPAQHDKECVKLLAWALSKADGSVARAFADADPPPDISWLEPLSKTPIPTPQGMADLFAMPGRPAQDAAFIPFRVAGPAAKSYSDPVTHQMTRWLTRHLDKKQLTDWVIAKNGLVSETFARFIQDHLPDTPAPWREFWRLILDGCNRIGNSGFHHYPSQDDITDWTDGMDAVLLNATQCRLSPRRGYGLMFQQTDYVILTQIAHFEVATVFDITLDRVWDKRTERAVTDALVRLLDQLYLRLADGEGLLPKDEYNTNLWEKDLTAPDSFDNQGHSQLVALCLYAHKTLAQRDLDRAQLILRHWIHLGRHQKLPLFLRMGLHAMAHHCDLPPQDSLAFITAQNCEVLWGREYTVEIGAYLRLKAPHLPPEQSAQLIKAVAAGPVTERDDENWRQRQIQRRAEKLRQGGMNLPPELDQKIDLHYGDMEEIFRSGASRTSPPPIAPDVDDPIALSHIMADEENDHHRADQFKQICKTRPLLATRTVRLLVGQESANWRGWDGLAYLKQKEHEQHHAEFLRILGETAIAAPDWTGGRAHFTLCGLIDTCAAFAIENTREREIFIAFWDTLWDTQTDKEMDDKPIGDGLHILNSPIEFLIPALLAVPLNTDGTLAPDILSRLTTAVTGDLPRHRIARLCAVEFLDWLHFKTPDWTQENLIARLTAEHPEAPRLWRHFFSRPKISQYLMNAVKPAFVSMAAHWDKTGAARIVHRVLAHALLHFPGTLKENEIGKIIRRSTGEDLRHFGWYLGDQMKNDTGLWRRAVREIIKTVWPSSVTKTTSRSVDALIRIARLAGHDFPDAIALMLERCLLGPLDDLYGLIHDLRGKDETAMDFVAEFPESVLNLLQAVAPPEISSWDAEKLQDLLDDVAAQNPHLSNDPRLIALRRLTIKKG